MSFDQLWTGLLPLGRHPESGGYRRYALTPAERHCRDWFVEQATRRGMTVYADRNRNLWAWRGDPDADGPGVVTGSHLDSVPDGGAYDGPLGIVSAFAALDLLDQRDRSGQDASVGRAPLGIVAFADEEGGRFGLPCVGSRLLTGALTSAEVLARTDQDGMGYAEALRADGQDPDAIGPDSAVLARIGSFVELHIEQGRGLTEPADPIAPAAPTTPAGEQRPEDGQLEAAAQPGPAGQPDPAGRAVVALCDRIWPHGRWRFEFTGRADHAGTTVMADRVDPMLSFAMTTLAANKRARLTDARATFGKVRVRPNGTNAIPSAVTGWLDARAPDDQSLDDLIASLVRQSQDRAERDQTTLAIHQESRTPATDFDPALLRRLSEVLGPVPGVGHPPVLSTAAGHDAGVLADAGVPAAMLFVRNPTGVSHSPAEYAEPADCHVGVRALAAVLHDLTTHGPGARANPAADGVAGAAAEEP